MAAFFERLGPSTFRATRAVQGAWNTDEQHIAPALGLLTHAVELDRDARRDDGLQIARLGFDILGTLPIETLDVDVRVVRAGRTIELVEATLRHDERPAVVLRAWLVRQSDSSAMSGSHLPVIPGPDDCDPWVISEVWPGEFVRTVEARRREHAPGRAHFWARPRVPLLEHEVVGSTARVVSVLDVANGITPRVAPESVAFPNLDTTVHLFAQPEGDWIGFDTTVSFGTNGVGLTHTVLHDVGGPIGTIEQILTIRPREPAGVG